MKKILIIDDDNMSLNSLNRLIQEWNYHTESYQCLHNNELSQLKSDYYCAIVDFKLPFLDGYKVLNQLMDMNKEMIPILISGFEIEENMKTELDLKLIHFLTKPINITKLKKILNNKQEKQ